MRRFPLLLMIVLLLSACDLRREIRLAARDQLRTSAPDSCPVTRPPIPAFMPPGYTAAPEEIFWYGTDDLWVALPSNGIWYSIAYDYSEKVFWGREGYVWTEEPQPDLFASGRRLDGPADPAVVSRATNGYEETHGSFMLIGMNFPTAGCWEITGRYREAALTFVAWVAP